MSHQKIVYIIPGFRQHPRQKAYKELTKVLKKEGYHPIPVRIQWKKTTLSENTVTFLKLFSRDKAKKKYILGFSFGAIIAFLASTKVHSSGLILCSLSPYFREDLVKARASSMSSITTRRFDDLSQLRCSTLAKQIKAKQTLLLYGTKEAKPLISRVMKAYRHIASPRKSLVRVRATEHDIADKRYLQSIQHATRVLH